MRVYFLLVSVIGCCVAEYCPRTPCSKEDRRCLEVLFNGILYDVARGIPEFNIQPSEPLTIDINAEFSTLSFQCGNTTVVGLKDISVADVLVSADFAMMCFTLVSPHLNLTSDFNADGYMVDIPALSRGKAENIFGLQKVNVYSTVSLINGTGGKRYMQFGNYSIDVLLEESYTASVIDIYDDDDTIKKCLKNIAEAVKLRDKDGGCGDSNNKDDDKKKLIAMFNHFAANNCKEMSFFSKEVVWDPIVFAILTNLNKYLARYPQDKIIRCR